VSYGDAVSAAVELLNMRAVSPYVLRLREAQPRPGWDLQLSSLQRLNFTIMETRCLVRSGARLNACEFKEDGVCSVPVPQRGSHLALNVTCVDSTVDPIRVKRFWPLLRVAVKMVAAGINLFKVIVR
ncbi:CTHL3 protein, partial [Sagittarius serpentarius]|nr:CTHL3 protein [Sagittarius serpentarius]